MREIKFRARCAVNRTWIYGFYVIENGTCFIINDEGRFKIIVGSQCQFTGLLDKNDKEIYEGDILIVYIEGIKQNRPYIVKDLRWFYFDINQTDLYFRISKQEIIGNIYENPKLLRETL